MAKRLLKHRKVAEDERATLDFIPLPSAAQPPGQLAKAALRHGKPFRCAAVSLHREVMVSPGKFKVMPPKKEKALG